VPLRQGQWARKAAASVGLACVVVLAAVGSAPAAFPGKNGMIVFSSTAGENVTAQLFSITPAGKGRRNLTRNLSTNSEGSWSPDGRRIAFARVFWTENPGNGLVVMNADGSRKRLLASFGRNPTWSPDGTLLAYVAEDGSIHVIHPDGRAERTFRFPGLNASGPAWAPDGGRLAAATGGGRLSIFDLADGTTREIVDGGLESWSSPMWSPDGSAIAYATRGGEIRLVRPDGSGGQVVARGGRAVWSPDGTRLAVIDSPHTLTVVRADGSGARTLSRHLGAGVATWSPEGRRVAFVEGRLVRVGTEGKNDPIYDTATDIYVANADGSSRRRVTHEPGASEVRQPVWSPDGRHILYSASYDYNDLELYAVGPTGRQPRPITRNNVNDYDPAWSADGTRLAFVRAPTEAHPGPGRIIVADALARHPRALTAKGSYASPTWSPNGKFIAFARWVRKQQASYVFVMRADGSGVRRLAPGGAPAWSPDGRSIALTDGRYIYVMRADGSHLRRIASYGRVLRVLNDAPIGTGLASPVWSPDGKQIAFVAGTSDDEERPLQDFTSALTVRPDGSHLRVRFGPSGELFTVDWSPDGKRFLVCGAHVRTRPVTGGNASDLTPRLSRSCEIATWQPR
jgi:Tol biopolymer transport system component